MSTDALLSSRSAAAVVQEPATIGGGAVAGRAAPAATRVHGGTRGVAELTNIQPAEYRADLVVLLLNGQAVLGIVIEAQLARDDAKQYAWPAYVVNLRARIKCPVCLLVITADEQVARWAAIPVELGGGQRFAPCVLSPVAVPRITDTLAAQQDPELAVFSAMAHGRRADPKHLRRSPSPRSWPASVSTLTAPHCMLTWY